MICPRPNWLPKTIALQTAVRWLSTFLVAAPILPPVEASRLLSSTRGDTELLTHGGQLLTALLLQVHPWLRELGPLLGAALVVTWAIRQLVCAITYEVARTKRSPFDGQTLTKALERYSQFLLLSMGTMTAVLALLGAFWTTLPFLGVCLYPSLGEVGTDLTELGVFTLVLLLSALLVLSGDVARGCITVHPGNLRSIMAATRRTMRYGGARLLGAAAWRFGIAAALAGVALVFHLDAQQKGNPASLVASIVVVESAALLVGLLQIGWTRRVNYYAVTALGEPAPPERTLS